MSVMSGLLANLFGRTSRKPVSNSQTQEILRLYLGKDIVEMTYPFNLNGNKRDKLRCPVIGEADGIYGRAF
jgi:hypothetical protein